MTPSDIFHSPLLITSFYNLIILFIVQITFSRAKKVIPGGVPGHLGTTASYEGYPVFSGQAKGAYFWDIDGNRFLYFMCAYGPNILGYNDEYVDAAAMAQLKRENLVTAPSAKMIEFAEVLVDTVDMADWALFAKNGSDTTSLALMIARAATGRKKAILINGNYHGSSPWSQRPDAAGVCEEDLANNIYVDWNNLQQVEQAIRDNPGEIACFLSTPYFHPVRAANEMSAEGYWEAIRKLCTDNGIVLAIDDIRCGFRLDLAGSDKYFGFKADLMCFCKALANGWSISALCGIDALKDAVKRVMFTGSYWLSAVPFAAGIACINRLKELNGAAYMLSLGSKYLEGLCSLAASHGYHMEVSGALSLFYLQLNNDRGQHRAWVTECVRRGVFLTSSHNMFTCCAMTEQDVDFSLEVADEALKAIKGME